MLTSLRDGQWDKVAVEFDTLPDGSKFSASEFLTRLKPEGRQQPSSGSDGTFDGKTVQSATATPSKSITSPAAKKEKYWDVDRSIEDERLKFRTQFDVVKQSASTCLTELNDSTAQCAEFQKTEPSIYAPRLASLESRGQLMAALLGTRTEFDEYRKRINKANENKSMAEVPAADRYPLTSKQHWDDLRVFEEVSAEIDSLGEGATSSAELAAATDKWLAKKSLLGHCVKVCNSAVAGFTAAKRTSDKAAQNWEKKAKAKAAAKAKQLAKAKSSKAKPTDDEAVANIFKVDLRNHVGVSELTGPPTSWDKPWVTHDCSVVSEIQEKNPLRLNLLVCKANLMQGSQQSDVKKVGHTAALREELMSWGPNHDGRVLDDLLLQTCTSLARRRVANA